MKGWGSDAQAARDAATILPVAAAVLLLPPFMLVFTAPVLVAGIPLIVVYVFAAWASIVLGAWLAARHLARKPDSVDALMEADATGEEHSEPGRP